MPTKPSLYSATHIAGRMMHELAAIGHCQTIRAAAVHAVMRPPGQSPSTLNQYPWPNEQQQTRIRELSDNPRS